MEITKTERKRILKKMKEDLIKKYGIDDFNKNHKSMNRLVKLFKPKGRIKQND